MTELAALVARRLCHDFAGPIGAISTAVEMLGGNDDAEVRALIGDSARGLSASLRLYRVVLAPGSGSMAAHELATLLRNWTDSREAVTVDWAVTAGEFEPARAATLLGLALIASEALPRGGGVHVTDRAVVATGAQLRLDPAAAAALGTGGTADPGGTAAPRAGLARLVAANAAAAGMAIGVEAGPGKLTLSFAPRRSTG